MQTIKPNQKITQKEGMHIFLAGSVQTSGEQPWRDQLINALTNESVTLFDPRTTSYGAGASSDEFKTHVNWELEALEESDLVVMYLDAASQSPISLIELGLYAQSEKLIVCCADGFWKKGNVEIVCERYGVHQVAKLEDLITEIKRRN